MTSAAMVFQYHGITKLPDSTSLDPGTLNTWLKNRPDGYIRNGLVNWLALTRLSKLAKDNNPAFGYDALEYRRVNGEDKPKLLQDLHDARPDILEEPGHFVVGRGTNLDTFNINDPFYNRSTLSDGYSNTFISLGRFIPSNTDLSYVMGVINSDVNISMSDNSGNVGDSFIQQPVDNDGGSGNSGDLLKVFYLASPSAALYVLDISSGSTKLYDLDLYLYDKYGNVKIEHLSGIVGSGDTDSYSIDFNRENSNDSFAIQNFNFDSLINDIKSLRSTGEINNLGVYVSLLAKANAAKAVSLINNKASVNILKALQKELNAQEGKKISESAYNILSRDINLVLRSF